jgi:hypothetical protein
MQFIQLKSDWVVTAAYMLEFQMLAVVSTTASCSLVRYQSSAVMHEQC